jgi:hypothetical protein
VRIAAAVLITTCLSVPLLFGQGAQPVIGAITGTVSVGSVLSITGSSLNAEARSNWIPFFVSHPQAYLFGGSSPLADGYEVAPTGPGTDGYVTDVRLFGSQSIKFHSQGAVPAVPSQQQVSRYFGTGGGDAQDLWIRAYVRYHVTGGWPNGYIKMIDGQGTQQQYYFQPSITTDNTLPLTMNATYDSAPHNVNIPSGRLQNDRWYCVEIHWKTNSSPYVFQAWMDGVQMVNATPTSQGSLTYLLFGLINYAGTGAGFAIDNWFGGLVVATSRLYPAALVEVGDGPVYATAKKRTQALQYISDARIDFTLDVTGLGSGPYYVWVTNNRQQLSSAVLLTTVGAPHAPTGVRIR